METVRGGGVAVFRVTVDPGALVEILNILKEHKILLNDSETWLTI